MKFLLCTSCYQWKIIEYGGYNPTRVDMIDGRGLYYLSFRFVSIRLIRMRLYRNRLDRMEAVRRCCYNNQCASFKLKNLEFYVFACD